MTLGDTSGILVKQEVSLQLVGPSQKNLAAPAPQDCSPSAPHKPCDTWAGAKLTAQTKCDPHEFGKISLKLHFQLPQAFEDTNSKHPSPGNAAGI